MSKVSIAIITPSLGFGGAERVSAQVSEFLENEGFDVTVLQPTQTIRTSMADHTRIWE